MGGDRGLDEGPGLVRRLGTGLAILLFVALAGATVRQAARLNPLSGDDAGPPGGLEIHAGTDRETGAPALTPPALGEWRVIPRAGIDARSDPIAVWTGTQVFLWGGWAREDQLRTFGDGALYDPAARKWTYGLHGAPSRWREGAVGVWTGSEVIVLGARRGVGQDSLAQAFDMARLSWRRLSAPPRGDWLWRTAVWTGTHVVVAEDSEGGSPGTLRYDPGADTWEQGGGLSTMSMDSASRGVWLDGQMVVSGKVPGGTRLMLQSFDPFGSAWRRGRGAPPSEEWRAALTAEPDADGVLLAGPAPGGQPSFLAARWNVQDGWQPLPEVPPPLRGTRITGIFATPAGPLLWPDGPVPPSLLSGGMWRPLPRAPREKQHHEAVVWTDHGLFVWGGHADQHSSGGAMFIPGVGAVAEADDPSRPLWAGQWEALPALPTGLGEPLLLRDRGMLHVAAREPGGGGVRLWRLDPDGWTALAAAPPSAAAVCVAHTDGRLAVLGTDQGRWQASLVHLHADSSTPLPPPPVSDAGMLGCASWRSRAVVVTGQGDRYDAAALDPETQRWELLPRPPNNGYLIAVLAEGTSPNAPLLVVTNSGVGRFADGAWTLHDTPRNSFPTDLPAIHWTGESLLIWGGRLDHPVRTGWSWSPATDRWRQMPAAWFGGRAARTPQAWDGRRWAVWGERVEQGRAVLDGGAYEPATRRWHRLPPSSAREPVTAALWDEGVVVLRADGTVERFRPAASS